MRICAGVETPNGRGVLVAPVGYVRPPYKSPSIEQEIALVRAKAARHGAPWPQPEPAKRVSRGRYADETADERAERHARWVAGVARRGLEFR